MCVRNFIVFDDKAGNEFHRERKYVHYLHYSSSINVIFAGLEIELVVFLFQLHNTSTVWMIYRASRFFYIYQI